MTASSQTEGVVDEVRMLLAAQGDSETLRRLIPASIRLLAEGEPVRPHQRSARSPIITRPCSRSVIAG